MIHSRSDMYANKSDNNLARMAARDDKSVSGKYSRILVREKICETESKKNISHLPTKYDDSNNKIVDSRIAHDSVFILSFSIAIHAFTSTTTSLLEKQKLSHS